MRLSQETTGVEDEEGSRRGREYEFFWLELTAEERQKEKGRKEKDGACQHLTHSENDRSRGHGRFSNTDTPTSAVPPPVLVSIWMPTQGAPLEDMCVLGMCFLGTRAVIINKADPALPP